MATEYENFREQVRNAADIVEVISGYVALKKKGPRYWGCCPFHGEKTPSFAVTPSKNMFFCFGCHEGGDVFHFIMKSENCSFGEAVKLLAQRYGIPIPEREKTPAEIALEKKNKEIMTVNDMACRYFHACLTKTDYGKTAKQYLLDRGITQDIMEQFSLGYALNRFDGLMISLGKRGYTKSRLFEAGLIKQNERGYYDTFRHRVMIPIKNPRGEIVGFGGRALSSEVAAKYLNTGETAWFNKKNLLFGLDVALKHIREKKQAVIVEGYMDAISLHSAGFRNVVASMGTAFTAEQAKLLRRIAEEIIFCYDSDDAGRTNSVRAVTVALQNGLENVKVAGVPEGKDPDEYVRKYGAEAFKNVLDTAESGLDFQINWTLQQNNVTNLAGKVEAVSNILPFLLECKTEIEVADHIRKLAEQLTINESLIQEEYRKLDKKGNHKRPTASVPQKLVADTNTPEKQAEKMLIAVLVERPEILPELQEEIESVGFKIPQYQELYQAILDNYDSRVDVHINVDKLYGAVGQEAGKALAELLANCYVNEYPERIAADSLRSMKIAFLEEENEKHCRLAAEYLKLSDSRYVEELRESQRIKDEIKNLYGKQQQ